MSAKALQYAEDVLGVHAVYAEVQDQVQRLDDLLGELDKARDARRLLEDEHADREVELIHEKRSAHPSMSDTRFKSEFKGWERTDGKLRELRGKLATVNADIQGLDYDLEITRARIRVGSSRMEELGGYLNYLAAVKNAAVKPVQTQAESDDKTPGENA